MSVIVNQVISLQLLKRLPQAHVSINKIEVSDDLSYATLWVSSFSAKGEQTLIETLESIRIKLQDSLAQHLKTKFTPKLRFKLDPGKVYTERIDKLLQDLR